MGELLLLQKDSVKNRARHMSCHSEGSEEPAFAFAFAFAVLSVIPEGNLLFLSA
jgi:hypothetical protein